MSRSHTSSFSFSEKRNSMFSFFSSGKRVSQATLPGIVDGEVDCLHDENLESPLLTAIWNSPTSKLDAGEKQLLEQLHAAYLSRTEALRTYQTTVFSLTEQITDLRTSNYALKQQLDITSKAHASLLTEITDPRGLATISDSPMTPQSEDEVDEWSDSGLGVEEDDTLTVGSRRGSSLGAEIDDASPRSGSPARSLIGRGNSATNWISRNSTSTPTGELKYLRKENFRLREEIERLEGILEDCSIVLGGLTPQQ